MKRSFFLPLPVPFPFKKKMPSVITIGESLLEIIFLNNQPSIAIPGGSVLNTAVSLGRSGIKTCFSGVVGKDLAGDYIDDFLKDNGIDTRYFKLQHNRQTPASLAFTRPDSTYYQFYRCNAPHIEDYFLPETKEDDILLIGSWFAVNPENAPLLLPYLRHSANKGTLIYYDLNFRKNHLKDLAGSISNILEIIQLADIIKVSEEDLENVFGSEDIHTLYDKLCPDTEKFFIKTSGAKAVIVKSNDFSFEVAVPPIIPISTIGAGDSFNAGLLHYLIHEKLHRKELAGLAKTDWHQIITRGIRFSQEVCNSKENYIPVDFRCDD